MYLEQLKSKLDGLINGRLWLQVIIGLVLGIVVGIIFSSDLGLVKPETAFIIGKWLALPGKAFLGLIAMVLVPLVFTSIIKGLGEAASGEQLKSVGWRMAVFVLLTTFLASGIGIALALYMEPGALISLGANAVDQVVSSPQSTADMAINGRVPDLIAGLIPTEPGRSILERDMLAIVIFAILIGVAAKLTKPELTESFFKLADALMAISLTVISWAMFLAPWAVFGLMAQLVINVGLDTIFGMGAYVLTVLIGLVALLGLYLLIISFIIRMSPVSFIKDVGGLILLAFSTSSSTAVMPLSISTSVEKLKVPQSIANLVIPLGATVNMAGTALYQSVAVVFLAQISGVDLSLAQLSLIVLTLVASSIGAPGTPGVSIVILSTIVTSFGIPTAGLVLILGVDRLLDMCRTAVNVVGDVTACLLLKNVGSK